MTRGVFIVLRDIGFCAISNVLKVSSASLGELDVIRTCQEQKYYDSMLWKLKLSKRQAHPDFKSYLNFTLLTSVQKFNCWQDVRPTAVISRI